MMLAQHPLALSLSKGDGASAFDKLSLSGEKIQ